MIAYDVKEITLPIMGGRKNNIEVILDEASSTMITCEEITSLFNEVMVLGIVEEAKMMNNPYEYEPDQYGELHLDLVSKGGEMNSYMGN